MAQVIQETAAPCLHNQSFTLSAVISTLLPLSIYVIIYLSIVFPAMRAGVCAVPVGGVEGGEVDIQIPA